MDLRVLFLIWLSFDGVVAAPRDRLFGLSQTDPFSASLKADKNAQTNVDTLQRMIKDRSVLENLIGTPSAHQKTWSQIGKLVQAFDQAGITEGIVNFLQWPVASQKLEGLAEKVARTEDNNLSEISSQLLSRMEREKRASEIGESTLIALPFILPSLGGSLAAPSFFPTGSFLPAGSMQPVTACRLCSSDTLPTGLHLDAPCAPGSACAVSCPAGYTRNPSVSVTCQCQALTLTSVLVPSSFTEAVCIPAASPKGVFCTLPQVLTQPYRFLAGSEYCRPGGVMPSSQTSCPVACPAGSTPSTPTNATPTFEFKCSDSGAVIPPNFTCVVDEQNDDCAKDKPECSAQFQQCLNLARYGNNGQSTVLPLCPCVTQFERCVGESNTCLNELKSTAFSSYSLARVACSDACRVPYTQTMALCSQPANPYCLNDVPSISCCNAINQYTSQCGLAESAAASLWVQPNYQNSDCKFVMSNIISFEAEKCLGQAPVFKGINNPATPTTSVSNTTSSTNTTQSSNSTSVTNSVSKSESSSSSSSSSSAAAAATPVTPTPSPEKSTTTTTSAITPPAQTTGDSGGSSNSLNLNSLGDSFNTDSFNSFGGSNSSDTGSLNSLGDSFGSLGSGSSDSANPAVILALLLLTGVAIYFFRNDIPFLSKKAEDGAPASGTKKEM